MRERRIVIGLFSIAMVWLLAAGRTSAAESEIVIERPGGLDVFGFPPPIPVSISGFTGEVDAALKFDLIFMGFTNVPPNQAKFLITGNNSSRVEGRIVEPVSKRQIFGRAYTGGSLRTQAHAFSDDICKQLTDRPPIAQTRIAFKVEARRGYSEIYIADYDGRNAQQVTRDGSLVTAPHWAGLGTLYYSTYKLGPPSVISHQLKTGARSTVARYPGSNISPAVSSDGRRVAMILSKGGSPDLYVSNADGTGLQQLTRTRAEESSPCWSPDNQTICYVSKSSGANQLYAISASGGEPRRLKTAGVPSPTEPAWSPDGKWIVFTSLMRDFNICIVPAAGGTATVLALGEDPSWAPNSRAIIFCKGPDHGKKLSLLDAPTKQVKDLPRISVSNSQPSWGPLNAR